MTIRERIRERTRRLKRETLTGTREERVLRLLTMAGWYEGRSVDISAVERLYQDQQVELVETAKEFFRAYCGLSEWWYIDREPKFLPQSSTPAVGPDFSFELYPRPDSEGDLPVYYIFEDEISDTLTSECSRVKQIAQERFTLVGHIGYYYPARVWIGESGKIYTTHEYDAEVHVYDNLIELIAWELQCHSLDSATVYL